MIDTETTRALAASVSIIEELQAGVDRNVACEKVGVAKVRGRDAALPWELGGYSRIICGT
jgi:hypothetical protein